MPDSQSIVVTRRELYELVWATPMYKLAPKYGISNVGLTKICKGLMVPTPYRGYWERIRRGSEARKIPLRELSAEEENRNRLLLTLRDPLDTREKSEAEKMAFAERDEERRIVVPTSVRTFHSAVLRTKEALQPCYVPRSTMLFSEGKDCFAVRIGKNSIKRAMLVLQALTQAFEYRGFPIGLGPSGTKLCVQILGEWESFSLDETRNRKVRTGPPGDPRRQSKYHPENYKYEYLPSGRFLLRIGEIDGYGRAWSDRKSQTIERQLNDFVSALILQAGRDRENRQKREEAERLRREEEQRRALEAERERLRKVRLQRLLDDGEAFAKASTLRKYIAAVREEAGRRHGAGDEFADVERWAAWAAEQADSLDPLASGKELPKPPDM